MGDHYATCREGNCEICGQAEGYCEHTDLASKWGLNLASERGLKKPAKSITPTKTLIWKIRAADGSFSKGGSFIGRSTFSKTGKTWHRASDVTSHLAQLDGRSLAEYSRLGCKIVVYEIIPTGDVTINEWIQAAAERKEKREEPVRAKRDRLLRDQLAKDIENKRQELMILEQKLAEASPYEYS